MFAWIRRDGVRIASPLGNFELGSNPLGLAAEFVRSQARASTKFDRMDNAEITHSTEHCVDIVEKHNRAGRRASHDANREHGMAEAFVGTIKRVSPRPNAETVMRQLSGWITHHNEVHKALGYRSREFIAARGSL